MIGQIKRQEPGHFAFYQLSARGLWAELATWQRWLVRLMRRISFAPVGANSARQKADFGDVLATLGVADDTDDFAGQISRVEQELLWARHRGFKVPDYVSRALREAVELARDRAHLPHPHRCVERLGTPPSPPPPGVAHAPLRRRHPARRAGSRAVDQCVDASAGRRVTGRRAGVTRHLLARSLS